LKHLSNRLQAKLQSVEWATCGIRANGDHAGLCRTPCTEAMDADPKIAGDG
jgi:NAD(P)-dependent dehydrogenase (short-subunit alcohol dehydrogenase family)